MKRKLVLDAGVLALYFAGDEKAKKYIDSIYEGIPAYMSEVNIAEFLYNYAKVFVWEAALVKYSLIRDSLVEVVSVNEELTINAAKIKLKHPRKLSLADGYLIALAKLRKATIITTDYTIEEVKEAPTILLKAF